MIDAAQTCLFSSGARSFCQAITASADRRLGSPGAVLRLLCRDVPRRLYSHLPAPIFLPQRGDLCERLNLHSPGLFQRRNIKNIYPALAPPPPDQSRLNILKNPFLLRLKKVQLHSIFKTRRGSVEFLNRYIVVSLKKGFLSHEVSSNFHPLMSSSAGVS